MKVRLLGIGAVVVAVGGALFISGAATAGASGTTHRLVAGSVQNFSAAVEAPIWTFTCDTKTTAWTFRIDDVQVIDSHGHPCNDSVNGTAGPWHVGMAAATGAGPVPFSVSATLHQNRTNGLFRATAKGTDPAIATWCQRGASLTVVAFSRNEQPLLLDATLGGTGI